MRVDSDARRAWLGAVAGTGVRIFDQDVSGAEIIRVRTGGYSAKGFLDGSMYESGP
jgi:hypothetical protein